jgi:hypothetical protein
MSFQKYNNCLPAIISVQPICVKSIHFTGIVIINIIAVKTQS